MTGYQQQLSRPVDQQVEHYRLHPPVDQQVELQAGQLQKQPVNLPVNRRVRQQVDLLVKQQVGPPVGHRANRQAELQVNRRLIARAEAHPNQPVVQRRPRSLWPVTSFHLFFGITAAEGANYATVFKAEYCKNNQDRTICVFFGWRYRAN
jgi:hypothetical protein